MTETVKQAARRLAQGAIRGEWQSEALHVYSNADGATNYWRIRARLANGEKWIRPMRLNGDTYELGEPELPAGKPLYRLHELSMQPGAPVWFCEGENCADALVKLGVLATTAGSASSDDRADFAPLAGRAVTLWPDNDTAGIEHMARVATKLAALGCAVETLDVKAMRIPEKGDAVDWLRANTGASTADLATLPRVRAARELSFTDAAESSADEKTLSNDDRAVIVRLAQLSPLEYDRVRKTEAKALGVRDSTLDKLVKEQRKDHDRADGIDFDNVEPWASAVDPNQLLTELATTIRRFIVCNDATAHSAALWVTMTWFMGVVQIAPLAVITAPEKRCGKSILLFILGRLVHRPLMASNITPAALFRSVDAWKPTLLVDEADSFMRDNEELRGLLNCGHTRDSAYIVRVVGDDHVPTKFCVWGAKALAGIGHLADTIMDRAIVLELRRKLPHEEVIRLRHAEPGLFDDLAAKLARVAVDYREAMRRARPELPAKLNDRAQDNWEPLLALADIAGGVWPERARKAALTISGSADDHATIGTELLVDIREVFESKTTARISTAELIAALCSDDEKPWATYNRGQPIRPRQVSKKLAEFSIASKNLRIAGSVSKGFEREQFSDAFSRYLATPSPQALQRYKDENPFADNALGVADEASCSAYENASATQKHQTIQGCSGVADRNPLMGGNTIVEVEV